MSKTAAALVIAIVIVGNASTIAILLDQRNSVPTVEFTGVDDGDAVLAPLLDAIGDLRADVDEFSIALDQRSRTLGNNAVPAPGDGGAAGGGLAGRLDEVLARIDGLEKTLASMKEMNDELAFAKLREKREEQFRSEDGYMVADELLAAKKFAVGANGILSFLEAHPDHPDTRDLMAKARDAFRQAGYPAKAIWLHEEMMRKFPENRGRDLYSLAMLEKHSRKIDSALEHITESVELANNPQERMNRMFYQAYLIHQRDGDPAGLAAYRNVARQATAAGVTNPAKEATRRAEEIASRVGGD